MIFLSPLQSRAVACGQFVIELPLRQLKTGPSFYDPSDVARFVGLKIFVTFHVLAVVRSKEPFHFAVKARGRLAGGTDGYTAVSGTDPDAPHMAVFRDFMIETWMYR